jgi:glycerol dehydrogenase-like iron-containing ADH family enzyme
MRTWHECSLVGWQQAMEQPRATLPRAALAVRKDAQRSSLVAAGTLALTLESAVRVAVDEALEAQARLLTFDAWRQTQEDA